MRFKKLKIDNFLKKNKYILIFGYTKLHAFFISKILESSEFSDRKAVFILGSKARGLERFPGFLNLIKNFLRFFLFRILVFFGADVAILLPHPEHLFSNLFFFSKKINKIYLFEDGLMNYLDVRLTGKYQARSKRRRIISRFLLYKFKSLSSYLSGCDERTISATFVCFPEYVFKPEKHGEIKQIENLRTPVVDVDETAALFLDQDIESLYEPTEAANLRRKIYEELSKFRVVYVKFHHDYLIGKPEKSGMPNNFLLLDDMLQNKMAEELIQPLKVGNVMGFSSSALVNIISFYEGVKCHAVLPAHHMVMTEKGKRPLGELMSDFGVDFIKI